MSNPNSPKLRSVTLAMTALLASGTAHGQVIECACDSGFAVGNRVVALVDNPWGASGLSAGSIGTVICGSSSENLQLLVRWDNWSGGLAGYHLSCDCDGPGIGSSSDWFVSCTDVDVLVGVTNITQVRRFGSLQGALDTANDGDVLEIDEGTLFEDDIAFPIGRDVTLRGAGMDASIIDGGGDASPDNPILTLNGQSSATLISDLTFRNGHGSGPEGAGGVQTNESSALFARVGFRDNVVRPTPGEAGAAHLHTGGGMPQFEGCVFSGGQASEGVFLRASAGFLGCLFIENLATRVFRGGGGVTIDAVNCTIVTESAAVAAGGSTMNLTNCVVIGVQVDWQGGVVNRSHCLYPGAPMQNGNVDGEPTFVDAENGDYRLAPGSLGIDAADGDAYLAVDLVGDLNGAERFVDDLSIADSGSGVVTHLDIGAFEFQAPPCQADLDGSGTIDIGDLNILLGAWGQPDAVGADVNGDGSIDISDLNILLGVWGTTCG